MCSTVTLKTIKVINGYNHRFTPTRPRFKTKAIHITFRPVDMIEGAKLTDAD